MIAKELYPFMQVYAVIIGLVVGSFLNVIIYRLPNNKSIIKPRSKCNGCGKQIAWYDNIPVLSYIALLAKCRNCKSLISIRYPLVEFICGMMALMLLNIYGPSYEFLVVVLLCFMLIAITFIDVDHFVIPNEFIIFGFIISIFDDDSIFKIKFFKLSAAEAPAALIKNSLSSLMFPSTIKIFELLIKTIHHSYCVGTLSSCHLQLIF